MTFSNHELLLFLGKYYFNFHKAIEKASWSFVESDRTSIDRRETPGKIREGRIFGSKRATTKAAF